MERRRTWQRTAADDAEAAEGRTALVEVATHWVAESNGIVEAVGVSGEVEDALGALGLTSVRIAEVAPAEGLAHVAWAAASGGAHGRRRGAATGRFVAWWTAAALVDLLHDWPVTADELEVAINEMRWYVWDEGFEPTGWSLRIAVEDPDSGLAWAVGAADAD